MPLGNSSNKAVSILGVFIYLQALDFLTTVAFLNYGVTEANPVVGWAMREGPSALGGLLLVKLAAVLLAVVCLARSRQQLLRQVTIFFGGLVIYNMLVLIINSPAIR